ncbi:hypothetical protein FJY71_06080, partial [candidate division WOR-3 bacterium]|nr:hypothetical protein [candidate division WOR-3 bacterium]
MRRFILALAASAAAATAVTNPVVIRYPRYIAGRASPTDSFVGTPFVLLAGARTDTASSVYGYKPRLLVAAGAQQRFWCDTTAAPSYRNKWQTDLAAWDSCPRLTGGAPAETMKVWVVAKSVDTLPRREGLRFRVHRLPSSGQPNLDSPTPDSVTTLDMTPTGNGAWVAGHVYESNGGPLLSNHVVLAFAGDSIVGSYVTEDNGVVEGYPAEPGYFMMAVRAGNIDSVSVYARTGFTTPSPHYTQVTPPWNVPAGDTFWVDLPPSGPAIEGVTRAPDYPLSTEDVFVRARIYKAGAGVDSARILYTTDTLSGWTRGAEDSIRLTDSTYVFHVPPQPDGSTVLYRLTAWSEGNNTTTALAYYFLPLDLSIYELQYCDTAVTRTSPYHGRYVHTAGTVNGVLTTTKFFIADSSGPWHSLCVYRSGGGADVHLGESLDVVGTMTEYRGLSEIGTIVRLDVNGSGRPFDTSKVTFDQARQEACECLCARVDSITVLDSTGLFNSGKTYRVRDFAGTDTLPLYVTAGCAFVGTPIPSGTFNLVANVGEYNTAELEPRYSEDIIPIVDVAAEAILAPAGTLRAGDTVSPVAVVTNLSTSTPARSFEFRFRIGTFYDVARTIALLGPGDSDTIVFNTWTATPGAHDLLAIAVFPGDPDHANDTARARVFVDDTAGSSGVWREERPLPAGARAVKDGGWLASDGQIVY